MRILVLGGDGMLGHQLFKVLSDPHEVRVTLRRRLSDYHDLRLFGSHNAYPNIDVRASTGLAAVLAEFGPDAICNAVGIIKQSPQAADAVASIEVNALFPHRLAAMAGQVGARVLHVSTDCVFSGRRGAYTEADPADPVDLYGRSKLLGEIDGDGSVTIRTSVIGLELRNNRSLVEWALAQRGEIPGFRRARYSGLTTVELARVCGRILTDHVELSGVWHVASNPISKYQLLEELFIRLGRTDVVVAPDDRVVCDRTLRADRFEAATGYRCPDWGTMLDELCDSVRARVARGPG